MVLKIGLAKCNDPKIKELSELYKKGGIKAVEAVKIQNGKEYLVTSHTAYTRTNNDVGTVRKHYEYANGDWYLIDRKVSNERGSYHRGVGCNPEANPGDEFVSLGGECAFIKQEDGNYIQRAQVNYPERKVSSKEIESAIDYIKGKGAVENYTRLLRNS